MTLNNLTNPSNLKNEWQNKQAESKVTISGFLSGLHYSKEVAMLTETNLIASPIYAMEMYM